MRTLSTLSIFALALSASAQTTHELTNSGLTFSPNMITMQAGDNIHVVLPNPHTCTEVSEATWNANGTTSNGGFNFGPGENTFSLDVPGTYYFVCLVHGPMGMKGQIIVTENTGVREESANAALQLIPNPANTRVHLSGIASGQAVRVLDLNGKLALETTSSANGMLDVSTLDVGTYVVAVKDEKGQTLACERLVMTR